MENILFFIYRLYGGGAERVVSNLSQALSDRYNITIAVFSDEEKTYPYNGDLVRIRLPYSKNPSKNNQFKRMIRFFVLVKELRKLKKRKDINVSISFSEQANIINVLSRMKDRICISMRTTLSKEINNARKMRVLSGFVKNLYHRADVVIVPSELAAIDLAKFFRVDKERLKVIYNYIDPVLVNKLAGEPISNQNFANLFRHKILLNVGRITPAKGQWLLFHVIKKIKHRFPDHKLVIIGEGESERDFRSALIQYGKALGLKLYDHQEEIENFHLEYDVYLLGFDSNPFRYMRQAQLLVFPSTFEGFPNVIIEAMESRLAIVAADCQSGPREILAPDTDPAHHTSKVVFAPYGVLAPALPTSSINDPVEPEIIEEWEKAIIALLDDNNLREQYISRGLERAADFERRIILSQWEKLIKG